MVIYKIKEMVQSADRPLIQQT